MLKIMPFSKLRTAIVFFFLMVCVINLIPTLKDYQQAYFQPGEPVLTPGHEFLGLLPYVQNKKRIGYLTDLNLSPESIDTGSFLSAQYYFAPIVLDTNYQDHKLILIDASTSAAAFTLMEQLPATPLQINPYRRLLVQRP